MASEIASALQGAALDLRKGAFRFGDLQARRARLMREAQTVLKPRSERLRRPRIGPFVWGALALGGAVAVTAVAVVVAGRLLPPGQASLAVSAPIAGHGQVNPNRPITLSFNQPMNEPSVTQALKIEPATAFTVAWESPETAVITPDHPLAANTDYQVTLVSSAQSQSGQTLPTNTTFSFATQPAPAAAPILESTGLGEADSSAEAFWDVSGNPGVTASTAWQQAATATVTPSPPASAVPSATPKASAKAKGAAKTSASAAAASPSPGAPTGSPAVLPEVLSFPPGGTPLTLSRTAASAVAVSAGPSLNLAFALPQADGTSDVTVAAADGTDPYVIWPSAGSAGAPVTALAWSGDNTVVFVTPTGIESVDITSFQVTTLFAFAQKGTAGGVVLAADGAYAYVPGMDIPGLTAEGEATAAATSTTSPTATPISTPGGAPEDGYLVDLTDTTSTPTRLPGSAGDVAAFSGDGTLVVWASDVGTGSAQTVLEVPTASPSTTPVAIPNPPTEAITGLALSVDGGEIAYFLGEDGLQVAATGDGTVLGTSTDVRAARLLRNSTQIAYVAGGSLWLATIVAPSSTPAVTECPGVEQALNQFVDAQVDGEVSVLTALSAPGVAAITDTPTGLSRGYAVSAGCDPDTATLTASARLIVDPSGGAVGELTDETIVLTQMGSGWQVTQLVIPPLHAEGAGPKVLKVEVTLPAAGAANQDASVLVTFDSDLQPGSVTSDSIVLEDAGGQQLRQVGSPVYDANTRTVTLTVAETLPAGAVIVVETAVTDIDGGHPAVPFTAPVGG